MSSNHGAEAAMHSLPAAPARPAAVPRVSVLMPVFNTERFVAEALRSISAQTFGDFELVALDDGSTDGSRALLEAHAADEPRMRLISRENLGLVHTRNQLLEAASGELVAWMDSDDVALPERLARQVRCFDESPALVCVGSWVECIDGHGARIGVEEFPIEHEQILEQQAQGGGMRFPSTMMRRGLARDLGGFRAPFSIGEDLDLFLRLGERGRLANLPQTLLRYRFHGTSVSHGLRPHWAAYRDLILELAEERRRVGSDRLQRGEPVAIDTSRGHVEPATVTHARWARRALAAGNRSAALKHALASVRADPVASHGWRALVSIALGGGRVRG